MASGFVIRACLALAPFLVFLPARAKVYVTPEQAVKEAFPGAAVERHTSYLSEEQVGRITRLSGSAPSSRIVLSWAASKDGAPLGTAYLETHLVRALSETILVVLAADGRVGKVEILSFEEPEEYLPRSRWLDQFSGRSLDQDLSLKGSIRGITGATLSSRAMTSAVRRVLATHEVLGGPDHFAPLPPPSVAPPLPPGDDKRPGAPPRQPPRTPSPSPPPAPPR